MITNQTDLIEQEFTRLGFGKVDKAVREQAARTITGETDLKQISSNGNIGEIKNLVKIYQEAKLNEFLQTDFDGLATQDKLRWLRNIIERPSADFQRLNFALAFSGRGGFPVSALFHAYRDQQKEVKDYSGLMLERILLSEKSPSITHENVKQYVDDMSLLLKIPQPYAITKEKLKNTETIVRSFLFNIGGNIYVLSYRKNGKLMHTLIDTGERRYKLSILKLLKDNGIEPADIERILLTHHHADHSGLTDIICMASGASVLMHPDFQWSSIDLDMSNFGRYIEKLPLPKEGHSRTIGNISFPILGDPVDIGEGAKLEILGLPEGDSVTHTADQLLFFYTPTNSPGTMEKIGTDFRPTDEIIFAGDLWLMHPPGFPDEQISDSKIVEFFRARRRRTDHRQENRREKDALKIGFSIITVKPGHGPEFLGSKIVSTLLAQRDILVKLGFDENEKKAVLNDKNRVLPINQIKEEAYLSFTKELGMWMNPVEKAGFGYKTDSVSRLLLRIYIEHTGGGELVGQDRKERRIDLKNKLSKLKSDKEQSEELRVMAESALEMIEKDR